MTGEGGASTDPVVPPASKGDGSGSQDPVISGLKDSLQSAGLSQNIIEEIIRLENRIDYEVGRGHVGGFNRLSRLLGISRSRMRQYRCFVKLANGQPIRCSVCGCPHIEALTIGHYNYNDSHRKHREIVGYAADWILSSSLEEVASILRIECVYRNHYHGMNGHYPSNDKMPQWGN